MGPRRAPRQGWLHTATRPPWDQQGGKDMGSATLAVSRLSLSVARISSSTGDERARSSSTLRWPTAFGLFVQTSRRARV